MIKVGITGGIGSGKSMLTGFFKLINVPVFEADQEAKKIINNSSIIRSKLKLQFGEDIYLPNNTIDRKKLADIIFNSPTSLERVNSIIHPEVRKNFHEWAAQQRSEYVVHEAAILFESGFYKMMDYKILVTAPVDKRIQRVMKRDQISAEKVIERIYKQWEDSEKVKLSDLVIKNDNTELLIPQLLEFDKKIRRHG